MTFAISRPASVPSGRRPRDGPPLPYTRPTGGVDRDHAAPLAVLQEGSEDAAAYRALEALAIDPDRAGVAELASAVTRGGVVGRPMVHRYLVFAGYGSDSLSAFQAVGDIYLGRTAVCR